MFKLFLPFLFLVLILFQPDTFSAEKIHQNNVIATVNGQKITQEDLNKRLGDFKNTDTETLNSIKQEIIDQLINEILLDEFIDKQGLIVTQEEIEREIYQIRNNITGGHENTILSLEQVLASIGSNIDEFKRIIKHSIALEKYFNNKLDNKTLEKYFNENKSLFNGE